MPVPARPIRVMVVDDSAVVRKLVVQVLATDPGIEVVGTAANGLLALQKLDQLRPDVLTLDVEMPVLDGLETLTRLRRTHPRLPVVMFSTLTERGASATLEALARGATDYVTKPSNVGRISESMERVRQELVPKVKVLGRRSTPPPVVAPVVAAARATSRPGTPAVPAAAPGPAAGGHPGGGPTLDPRVDVVAIGVSTGGPNALAEVFAALPPDLAVPVVVVQHMPPVFTRLLAERLTARSPFTVVEAVDGTPLRPGVAHLAPGDHHLLVRAGAHGPVTAITQGPPEHSCRPAVDPLLRSVVDVYGSHVLAVVLTGMGSDGTSGCRAVQAAGGRVVAQDEATSVVWGMPGQVVHAGLADVVVPLGSVADVIARRVRHGRATTPHRVLAPARER